MKGCVEVKYGVFGVDGETLLEERFHGHLNQYHVDDMEPVNSECWYRNSKLSF